MGYSRYCVLRMVPRNGEAETLDLMAAFTDADGPVRVDESHVMDRASRRDVNRRNRGRIFGYRWRVRLTFHVLDMTDQAWLAQIVNRAADSDEWSLYLSVDAGSTEEQVELTSHDGPDPIGGKTVVGAAYALGFESVDLLDEVPNIDPDAEYALGSPPVYVPDAWGLPTATAALRGRIFNYRQADTPDQAVVCLSDGVGGYSWYAWAIGG